MIQYAADYLCSVFSRQRYWGEPFPIVFGEDGKAIPVPEDQLPVTLPQVESYQPSGETKSRDASQHAGSTYKSVTTF